MFDYHSHIPILRYTEDSQPGLGITSPYGQTKYMIEQILKDVTKVNNSKWKVRSMPRGRRDPQCGGDVGRA